MIKGQQIMPSFKKNWLIIFSQIQKNYNAVLLDEHLKWTKQVLQVIQVKIYWLLVSSVNCKI